jgi:putative cell wall-binding protein
VGWTTSDTVIVAPADPANLVDSLAVAPLAGQEKAPVLLTYKASLDAAVRDRIVELAAKKVYVVGALSDAVASQIGAIPGVTVEVLKGTDRWATADAITAKLTGIDGTFVVGYNAIADALSVASFAAANRFQILLTDANGDVSPSKLRGTTYLVGGTGVVRDIDGTSATRLGGSDRYATNARVVEALDYNWGKIYVANGASLVDALAAASLAGLDRAPILLTNGTNIPALTNAAVSDKTNAATRYIALGGTGAVPESVIDTVETTGPIEVSSVQGVVAKYNTRASGQLLGVKINNGTTVTPAQLDAAGYDTIFRASEWVFDNADTSDTGELEQSDLQDVYDAIADHIFSYTIEVSKRAELIAESDEVEVELYDGRTTAANSITSYRLDLIDGSSTIHNIPEGIKSNTLIEGEWAGLWNVKARTVAGGTDVNVTEGIKLESSDPWVVSVNDDDDIPVGTSPNERHYHKTLEALSEGKATITITSGAVTESFTITVKPSGDDDRVPYKAAPDASTLKIATGGYDYVRVVVTDQYGDPYTDEDMVFSDKDRTKISVGTTVDKTVASSPVDIAGISAVTLSRKGVAYFQVTGLSRDNAHYFYLYGDKWAGADVFKELGRVKLDIGTLATNYDASKSKFVAADTDAVDFTIDRNAFATAQYPSISLHLMKYTSSGYAMGAFDVGEYVGYSTVAPAAGEFALNYSRVDYIDVPTVGGAQDMVGDVIEIYGDPSETTVGSLQLKAIINPTSGNVVTKSQNIKVVSTVPAITKATFESLTEVDNGDYNLDELLLLDNIVTESTLGTGILYLRVNPLDASYVSLIYRDSNDLTVATTEQEVGRVVFNTAGIGLVEFIGSDASVELYDDPGDIIVRIDNTDLATNKNVQFGVQRFGSKGNVATKSVRILKP